MALVGVLVAVLGGQAIGTVLAGLSIPAWIEIASFLLKAQPLILTGLVRLHPAFAALVQKLEAGPQEAAQAAHATIHGPQYHGGPKGP